MRIRERGAVAPWRKSLTNWTEKSLVLYVVYASITPVFTPSVTAIQRIDGHRFKADALDIRKPAAKTELHGPVERA